MNKKLIKIAGCCFMICVIIIGSVIIANDTQGVGVFSDPPGIGKVESCYIKF